MTSATTDRELDADAPGWFHSSDGWYWRRCSDGDVAIVRRIQETDDGGARIYRITAAHRIASGLWASIVAHVSADLRAEVAAFARSRGPIGDALDAPELADPAAASYDAAITAYRQARALDGDDTLDERPRKGKQ